MGNQVALKSSFETAVTQIIAIFFSNTVTFNIIVNSRNCVHGHITSLV